MIFSLKVHSRQLSAVSMSRALMADSYFSGGTSRLFGAA
jgi:hypothetical protein